MILLDSANPPLGLWFVKLEKDLDFMGCLAPVAGKARAFTFDYRFRHQTDEEALNEKHWRNVDFQGQPGEVINTVRNVVERVALNWPRDEAKPPEVDELLYSNYPDFPAFLKAFQERPYAYSRGATARREARSA